MKAGDLVLVRNNTFFRWELSIFAYENPYVLGDGKLRYKCLNGTDWNECLPYVGNEDLLGTIGTVQEEFAAGQLVAVKNDDDEEWRIRYFKRKSDFGLDKALNGHKPSYVVTKELPSEDASAPRLTVPKEEVYEQCHLLENVFKGFAKTYASRKDG